MIETAIQRALQSCQQDPFLKVIQFDYSYIDSISKLITILLRTIVKFNRNELLDRIFDAFLLVLEKNYDAKNNLQRPFFRFLFNIIYDLKRPEYAFQPKEI